MPISTRALIQLCQRVSMSVRSGIDARRIWEMEEKHARDSLQPAVATIRESISRGGTVAEGMQETGGYFPPLFVQMVAVGEQTGRLDEVLQRLGEHYQHLTQMQRAFWFGIAWPLIELGLAVLIIGGVIFLLGVISAASGTEAPDVLGFGLKGTSGAITWFLFCGLAAAGIAAAALGLVRGYFGPGPVLAAMRIPILGSCMESLALSRLTWALALSLESGMDARRSVELAIRSAQNPYYDSSLQSVAEGIRANRQFHESFASSGVFPEEFVKHVEIAEEAGATNEALLRLSKEYEERARTAMRILTAIATVAVMLIVGAFLIYLIFSLFVNVYMKPINDALEMSQSGRI